MKSLLLPGLALLPLAVSSGASLGKSGAGLYLLTNDNRISSVCDTLVTQPSPPRAMSGLIAGDELLAIDVRPENQELYGLARSATGAELRLYHLTPATGAATVVGNATDVTLLGATAASVAAARFDIDFNPMVDRLRVVSSGGLNFRINPNNGVAIPDAAINGETSSLDGVAYTNDTPHSSLTTLYSINSATSSIYRQNPPNNGTAGSPVAINASGLPVAISAVLGFDIAPGVNAAVNSGPASGQAYAALAVTGGTRISRIDLVTGATVSLGVPAGLTIRSLAVCTQLPAAIGLNATGTGLVHFLTSSPGTTTAAPLSGVTPGETMVGIDFRAATGQLYGLGVNAAADTASLYLIEPASGSAGVVGGASSLISLSTAGGVPLDLPVPAAGYGVNFNTVVDRLRVVTGSGLNFRVNPSTGVAVDGDASSPQTNPDAAINGLPAGSTGVTGTAYTSAYAGATVNTQYTLDPVSNRLFIQNPPNIGTQTTGQPVTLNGSPLDFAAVLGFDIPPESAAATSSNLPTPGYGMAALNVAGSTGLYRIDLLTAVATYLGPIGAGGGIAGLTVVAADGAGFAPLTWTSQVGVSYRLETSDDLLHWLPRPGTVAATQTTTTVPVPLFKGESHRFWRAVSL